MQLLPIELEVTLLSLRVALSLLPLILEAAPPSILEVVPVDIMVASGGMNLYSDLQQD
jgi:hypothetical protein